MSKIYQIIKKNLRTLIRSKTSAAIIIAGPLILMLLVGAAFNTSNLYDISIATYSPSYSPLSNEISDLLVGQQFKVVKMDSEEVCISAVKQNTMHVCVIYPPDLQITNEVNNIDFYVDQSRMNLIWIITDAVSEKVSLKSSEISEELTGILVTRLQNANTILTDKKDVLTSLNARNSESIHKLKSTFDTLQSTDLSANISVLDELINESEEYNESEEFDDLLDDIKTQVIVAKQQLEAAKSVVTTATLDIEDVKNKMVEDAESLSALDSSVKDIIDSINSIEVTNVESIVSPINTNIKPVIAERTHLSYLFPTLIMFVVMFISLLLAAMIVIKEKLSKAHFRNFLTPTSNLTFLVGGYITNIMVIFLQLIILFAVISIFLQKEIIPMLLGSTVALLLLSTVFILIGMLIGYIFNSEETAILAAIAVGSIFLIFSNTILPMESIPTYMRQVAAYTPFSVGEGMLKQIMVFQNSIVGIQYDIYIILGYIVVLFVGILLAQKFVQKKYILTRFIMGLGKKKKHKLEPEKKLLTKPK